MSDAIIESWLAMPLASGATATIRVIIPRSQLATQGLRDQTNIRAARSAETRPIDVLRGTFRTKHFGNPSSGTRILRVIQRDAPVATLS